MKDLLSVKSGDSAKYEKLVSEIINNLRAMHIIFYVDFYFYTLNLNMYLNEMSWTNYNADITQYMGRNIFCSSEMHFYRSMQQWHFHHGDSCLE